MLCLTPEIEDFYWPGRYLFYIHDDLGLTKQNILNSEFSNSSGLLWQFDEGQKMYCN